MEANLEYRKQQAKRICRETGFPVPEFVYSLVPVSRTEAAKLAFDLGLVTYNPEQGDRSIYIAEFEGLALCRRFNISVEQARSLNGKVYRSKNAAELFEALPTAVSAEDASTSEQLRRQNRQNQLLSVETAILKRRKVPVPDFITLADYLGWVSKFVVLSRMHTVTEILWDFQAHYNQALFNSASRSFDPLADWEKYIKGEVDLKDWKNGWDLQNMGEEDIDYFGMLLSYRILKNRFVGKIYRQPLLTHSTNAENANKILQAGFLNHLRINFSAGRICGRYGQVAFIFPREPLLRNYNLQSYTEPTCERENEMRAYEPISLDFCLGIVPVDSSLFPDVYGAGMGRLALGDNKIREWGDHYTQTGQLWTIEEATRIKTTALNYDFR